MRIDGTSGRWAVTISLWVAAAPMNLAGQTATYLDFAGLTDELRSIVNGSDLASMRSLGTSHEGREIWLIEIADRSGPPNDQRPAVLVVGNLSGDHLVGSHLALETVRHLVGAGAAEADLSNHVIYVVPRLNPDGAEVRRRGNALAYDDDNDGRTNEDGPEDLNGDGVITIMRVADPAGAFMTDPDDPRLMKRADAAKGERGTHTLFREGRDNDGDGFINEDGPGGVDLDRNFQHEYPYWDADAGYFMVGEPESRALMDFVIGRRNIAAIVTFGYSDNLVTPPNSSGELADASVIALDGFARESLDDLFLQGVLPVPFQPGRPQLRGAQPGRDNDPSSGRRPEVTVHADDREYFNSFSEAYQEITGISEVALNRKAGGAFFQYGYFQFGVPSFSTPGWGLPHAEADSSGNAEDKPSGAGDARLLSSFDGAGIDAFVPWTPYQHADLGMVEIGGFRSDAMTNPPADQLPELGAAHGAFVARVSSMLARVRIADTEVVAHGGGLFTVTVEVVNEGYLPSSLQHGVVSRTVGPVIVQIQVSPENVVTGAAKTHRINKLNGSGARESVSWVIRGSPGSSIEIRVRSDKGGTDRETVTLRGNQ